MCLTQDMALRKKGTLRVVDPERRRQKKMLQTMVEDVKGLRRGENTASESAIFGHNF